MSERGRFFTMEVDGAGLPTNILDATQMFMDKANQRFGAHFWIPFCYLLKLNWRFSGHRPFIVCVPRI